MFGEQYASIYPKIKSWMQEILKKEDMDSIYQMDYPELVQYIKSKIKKVNFGSDESTVIEGALKQEGFYFLQSSRRFLSGPVRDFIKAWGKIYEIENLKILTRAIVNNKKAGFLFDLGNTSKIQKEMVKEVDSLEDLQQFLSGTEYYRLAMDSFSRVREEKRAFYFEVNLDNYYALNIKKKMRPLSFADKKNVESILFFYLEINRILWVYRAKFNYGMANESVVSIIPNIFKVLEPSK